MSKKKNVLSFAYITKNCELSTDTQILVNCLQYFTETLKRKNK